MWIYELLFIYGEQKHLFFGGGGVFYRVHCVFVSVCVLSCVCILSLMAPSVALSGNSTISRKDPNQTVQQQQEKKKKNPIWLLVEGA